MNIAILGANGRMGQALLLSSQSLDKLKVSAAFVRGGSELIGQTVQALASATQNTALTFSSLDSADPDMIDVLIDFTLPDALSGHLTFAKTHNIPIVIGTTGLEEQHKQQLNTAAQTLPIVFAANYSVGVTLMARLCQIAARTLSGSADIEIIEAHHRHKRDAPSGTALAIGEAIAAELNWDLNDHAVYAREGDMGERENNTIGFSTIRGGDIIGEHTALFADIGERLEITHKASSRETFAKGALRAALWLTNKSVGLYDMEDVLGLK